MDHSRIPEPIITGLRNYAEHHCPTGGKWMGLLVGVTVVGMIAVGVLHPYEIQSDWGFWLLISTPIIGYVIAMIVWIGERKG